jgi:uncharacterized membrane protein YgaE (UPF0421/DUF939 family)
MPSAIWTLRTTRSSIVIGGLVAVIVSLMFPSTQVAALHRDRKWGTSAGVNHRHGRA